MKEIEKFIRDQLSVWPMAAANFRALKSVQVKEMTVCGTQCRVQFNPCRIASSTADTSPEAIAARPCFLCSENRPAEQFHLKFNGRKHRSYNIQVNPFPIFPGHLVIARCEHIPQAIWHHFPDMMSFCLKYPEYTVFYNGPRSGASAPDHLHFQACPRSMMPLECAIDSFLDNPGEPIATNKDATLYHYTGYTRGVFALKSLTSKSMAKLFYRLLCCCSASEEAEEPRFNLYTWHSGREYRTMVILRGAERSHHYFAEGEEHLAMTPGAADMAGVFIAPMREDFDKVDARMLADMLEEVTIDEVQEEVVLRRLTRLQPTVDVGIMSGKEIEFEIISDGAGPQKVFWADGRIAYNGMLYDSLVFDSITRSTLFAEPSFLLYGVTIGIGFHWERQRDLKFAGQLRFEVDGDRIVAINRIGVEDYLLSVISSEMKSSAGPELLKAHAVISRSWLYRRIADRKAKLAGTLDAEVPHLKFDVCADDCCQRYQGLTMAVGNACRIAIDTTWGQTLQYDGEICDTRYSKCCGGRTEKFSSCWEDVDYPYLQPIDDPFCDCENSEILSQVLNDYDMETRDFHDWTVRYGREEISELIRRKTGEDIGTLKILQPVETGPSGRIIRLMLVGSKGSTVIGKELAIRKALSPNCLKSSAFSAQWEGEELVLRGRGWGHGVGLCQIGAAVMASEGYDYIQILSHYYKDAVVR